MINKKIYHWGFSLPAIVLYSLLFILPVTLNFYYSLTDWNAIKITGEVAHFIGFDNFKKIFSNPELTSVITRTVEFGLVTTVLKNVIGFTLALLFNEGLKSRHALRAVYFMPSMLSPLIIGLIFGSLLMTSGFFNQLLGAVGLENLVKPWLTTSGSAFGSVMFVEVWRQTGFNMVIYLAGLQTVPKEYYESADLDGTTGFQKFRYITVPLILPTFTVNITLTLINGLKVFGQVYALTSGGPADATQVFQTFVYKYFSQGLLGYSSAAGLVFTVVIMVVSLTLTSVMRKKEVSY